MIKIAPSILAADFSKLGSEVLSVDAADYIHFDVMDGVFVPNISFGFPILESVRKTTDTTLDVHLMIDSPSHYTTRFAEAGGDIITFHAEAGTPQSIRKAIGEIHRLGKKAGLALRPDTPAEILLPYIDSLDIVLVMTVEPGYGGQEFMPEMLSKVTDIREIIDSRGLDCELEVDGGINQETAGLCIAAGANVLVAGVAVFRADDKDAYISKMREAQPKK